MEATTWPWPLDLWQMITGQRDLWHILALLARHIQAQQWRGSRVEEAMKGTKTVLAYR